MDLNKLHQWIALQEQVDRHAENASAALDAMDTKDKIVNRHLFRIVRRESDLSDFISYIAESPAFKLDQEGKS